MLVSMKEILDDAKARGYGVGFFDTFNSELILGVMDAAEEMKAPVIIGTAEVLLPCCDMEMCLAQLLCVARRSPVPVAVHLDHGFTPQTVYKAVDAGFTSVMLDCSEAPYEKNVELLSELTRAAHKKGVSVEGELGHVVFDTKEDTGSAYTQPEQAADFVKRTGVDALAVAIGTAHGPYKEKPVLDLGRLREIRAQVPVSLVLHGGSGLSDQDFRNCVRDGIQKINIYTDISYAATGAAHDFVEHKGRKIEDVSLAMRAAVREATRAKLQLFGCAGKA